MKEILATITSKGQVTVPEEVRRHLGVSPRNKLAFLLEADGTVRLSAPRYPDVASLGGAAGTLEEPLSWERVEQVAQKDRLRAKYRPRP